MTAKADDSAICDLHPLRLGDVKAVAGQCRGLFRDTTWDATALEHVLAAPGYFALLAHTAGDAAGLILARAVAVECEIPWIVVGPSWRRKGLGRRLLRSALRQAATLGAATAYLEVAATNRAAIALYGAEGFQTFGRRTAYYRYAQNGTACDAVLYKKVLEIGEGQGPRASIDRMKAPKNRNKMNHQQDEGYTIWPNSWTALWSSYRLDSREESNSCDPNGNLLGDINFLLYCLRL